MGREEQFLWPEQAQVWKHISKEFYIAFFSAFGVGFLTHLYALSNILLSHDAVAATFSPNSHLELGRWALMLFSCFSLVQEMPVVLGLISLFMIALTAGITVRVLDISHPAGLVLVAAFLAVFPSVCATFSYIYTADAYFIALFFNAMAVYLAKFRRRGWLCAIVLITVALGIYQSYICYAAGLFVIDIILMLFSKEDIKRTLTQAGKYILILIAGMFFYCLVELGLLRLTGGQLMTYQGLDSIGRLDLLERLSAIPKAYEAFFHCFFGFLDVRGSVQVAERISQIYVWGMSAFVLFGALLLAAALAYLIVHDQIYRDIPRFFCILLGYVLLPLALAAIVVLAYESGVTLLIEYAFVLLPVLMVKMVEMSVQRMIAAGTAHWHAIHVIAIVFFAAVCWYYVLICNIQYHSLQLTYENSFALANRITARIESMEDYHDQPISFIGATSDEQYGNTAWYAYFDNEVMNFSPLINYYSRMRFFNYYIGSQMEEASEEQTAALKENPAVLAMPAYPAPGSIAIVDNVVVVKLGEIDSK